MKSERNEILRPVARQDARNVCTLISVVPGEAAAGSDIDLLVDVEEGQNLSHLGKVAKGGRLDAAMDLKLGIIEIPVWNKKRLPRVRDGDRVAGRGIAPPTNS